MKLRSSFGKFAGVFICYIVLVTSLPSHLHIQTRAGESVVMAQPSLSQRILGTTEILGTTATIEFKQPSGKTDVLKLAQDLFEGPQMIVPSTNTGVYFCIYDHDVDWLLMRIDVSQPYSPPPNNSPISGKIVSSTCKVERVLKSDTEDWDFVATWLDKLSRRQYKRESAGLDLVFYKITTGLEYLRASMHRFGDEGTYDGESTPILNLTNSSSSKSSFAK